MYISMYMYQHISMYVSACTCMYQHVHVHDSLYTYHYILCIPYTKGTLLKEVRESRLHCYILCFCNKPCVTRYLTFCSHNSAFELGLEGQPMEKRFVGNNTIFCDTAGLLVLRVHMGGGGGHVT